MRLFLLTFALFASSSSAVFAQDTNMITPGGDWFVGGNWSSGTPTITNSAGINSSTTASISAAGAEARSLDMNFGSTVNVNGAGTLTIAEGINTVSGTSSTLNIAGTLTVGTNGAPAQTSNIINSGGFGTSTTGTVNLRDNVNMTVTTSSSVGMANINNAGRLTLVTDATGGEYQQRGTINNTGTLIRSTNRNWTMNDASITNSGRFESVGAFIESGTASFSNSGTFVATPGTTSFSGVDFTNTGILEVQNGATVSFTGGSFDGDSGTVNVLGSGSLSTGAALSLDAATLTGTGSITDDITMTGGSIAPGDMAGDIGVLQLGGSLTLDNATTLTIDLGAGGADRLAVGSTFDHGGATLDLDLAGDFMGTLGQTFTIASHAARAGSSVFANSMITEGIYEFEVNYNATSTVLRITAVPEPSSIAILGLASGIAFVRRRKS